MISGRIRSPAVESPAPRLRQAVVTAVDAGPPATLTVQLGGDPTDVAGVRYLASYGPTVGDTVWLLQNGPDLLVIGRLALTAEPPSARMDTDVRTSNSAFINTTETVIATLVFDVVAGRIYKLTADLGLDFTIANDEYALRFREDTVSGTQLQSKRISPLGAINDQNPWHVEAEYTAASTTAKTIVCTLVRINGTGSVVVNGSTTQPSFVYADYVRG